jgi:hypothetical protein
VGGICHSVVKPRARHSSCFEYALR